MCGGGTGVGGQSQSVVFQKQDGHESDCIEKNFSLSMGGIEVNLSKDFSLGSDLAHSRSALRIKNRLSPSNKMFLCLSV